MSLNTAIFLIGTLDLGVVLAVAAKDEAAIFSFAAPLSEDLAA